MQINYMQLTEKYNKYKRIKRYHYIYWRDTSSTVRFFSQTVTDPKSWILYFIGKWKFFIYC